MKHAHLLAGVAAASVSLAAAGPASAFCGFYVGGAETRLFNDATQVVLMRDGIRTALSMANTYKGPPEGFAMVVPVPVVLHEENVKTLPASVFDKVDQMGSPRLVEYWEQDPCPSPRPPGRVHRHLSAKMGGALFDLSNIQARDEGVKVEAQFAVGEYEIVILSATDSTGLDRWLVRNKYQIPVGAEPYLRPYVQQGMKFFVAKVDVAKVRFEGGRAVLSPLRFHYDSEQFFLPIRLGLINSAGSQDLIVNVLSRNQRYDVANYENVAIPTNIEVSDDTRRQFPAFYTRLFEDTLARHPRAVVTEYSWQATTCDPCPVPPLERGDLALLGADVAPSLTPPDAAPPPEGGPGPIRRRPFLFSGGNDFVLTRMHVRYTKDVLGDDLFFRAAPPIAGGREHLADGDKLEQGAVPAKVNNFQARYSIRHPWTGAIKCAKPQRGVWGGPPGGGDKKTIAAPRLGLQQAGDVKLAALVNGPVPPETFLAAAGATPAIALPPPPSEPDAGAPEPVDAGAPAGPPSEPPHGGCAGCATSHAGGGALGALVAALALGLVRRARRRE